MFFHPPQSFDLPMAISCDPAYHILLDLTGPIDFTQTPNVVSVAISPITYSNTSILFGTAGTLDSSTSSPAASKPASDSSSASSSSKPQAPPTPKVVPTTAPISNPASSASSSSSSSSSAPMSQPSASNQPAASHPSDASGSSGSLPSNPAGQSTAPAGGSGNSAPPATSPVGMSTMKCMYCSTQLSFPSNSIYIQCPKCNNTMNPQTPAHNYINCLQCNTLLSHPPSSVIIQCPKCTHKMHLPVRVNLAPPPEPTRMANPPGAPTLAANASAAGGINPSNAIPATQISSSKGGQGAGASASPKRKRKHSPSGGDGTSASSAHRAKSAAYSLFCKERRSKLQQENPDIPFGRITKLLGEAWRALSAEEKKTIEQRAATEAESSALPALESSDDPAPAESDGSEPALKKTMGPADLSARSASGPAFAQAAEAQKQ